MSKSKAGDLYIASVIHVRRGTKDHPEIATIQPGQMVSDTDLKDEEIEDLKRHPGVLRAATFEEEQAMDSREERQAAADAVRKSESERTRIAAEQQAERDRLAAEQRAADEKERVRLEAEQAKERAAAEKAAAKKVADAGRK
jgi:colicin import membrane protein